MSHEAADIVVSLAAIIGAVSAIVSPLFFRSDVKRSMAESWGKVQATVDSHGERLDQVEADVSNHERRVSYMEGKANGHAAGKSH